MTPLPAAKAFDHYFLDARARLLDLAAMLDRVDRGGLIADPRAAKVGEGLAIIAETGRTDRAERIQTLFSLDYDPAWKIPKPREL